MGRLTAIGAVITICYSAVIFWLISNRTGQLITMKLSELGDFLAGVFGPLAIFWLILGFLQQGKELKQSTTALELQAVELNNSVQQQKQLVEVARQQMGAEIESLKYERQRQNDLAKPNFIFAGSGGIHNHTGLSKLKVSAQNTGGVIAHVLVTTDRNIKLTPEVIPLWETNKTYMFKWEYKQGDPEDLSGILIQYTDRLGNKGEDMFEILINNEAKHPTAMIQVKTDKPAARVNDNH